MDMLLAIRFDNIVQWCISGPRRKPIPFISFISYILPQLPPIQPILHRIDFENLQTIFDLDLSKLEVILDPANVVDVNSINFEEVKYPHLRDHYLHSMEVGGTGTFSTLIETINPKLSEIIRNPALPFFSVCDNQITRLQMLASFSDDGYHNPFPYQILCLDTWHLKKILHDNILKTFPIIYNLLALNEKKEARKTNYEEEEDADIKETEEEEEELEYESSSQSKTLKRGDRNQMDKNNRSNFKTTKDSDYSKMEQNIDFFDFSQTSFWSYKNNQESPLNKNN